MQAIQTDSTDLVETGRGKNSQKGKVKVETDKGWLRLRFSYQGKRYALTLGLPDSKVNRMVAEQKAHQIELDIISGNFDKSLRKYKTQRQNYTCMTAADLYERFIGQKYAENSQRTPENY